MRLLLDECLPRKLKSDLPGHKVHTVPEMGWASKENGELLELATGQFDVFLTVDRNLTYQQDVGRFNIAVLVLVATRQPAFQSEATHAPSYRSVAYNTPWTGSPGGRLIRGPLDSP